MGRVHAGDLGGDCGSILPFLIYAGVILVVCVYMRIQRGK